MTGMTAQYGSMPHPGPPRSITSRVKTQTVGLCPEIDGFAWESKRGVQYKYCVPPSLLLKSRQDSPALGFLVFSLFPAQTFQLPPECFLRV